MSQHALEYSTIAFRKRRRMPVLLRWWLIEIAVLVGIGVVVFALWYVESVVMAPALRS